MAGNNKNGIYLRFNFPDKNTVKRDLMNLLKETNGTVDLKFDFPSVTQIQQKLQQILNEATMGLNVNTEHWIDTQRIGANLDKVRQQLLIISYQVSQAFNLSQIDTNGLAKFAQGLENIGNKASSVQQVKTAIDGVYSSCKTTTQAISQFMNTKIGVNIDPSKKVLSMGSNLGKELNQQLREAFNNKDIDSFVKSAQNAYSKGIEKSLSQSVGKDTLNQLKTQYKTLVDQISGTKISIKNIGISKEAEAQLRQSIRGYAKIDNVNGTSLDSMVGEWKNISQQNGLNLFNTGNMEDAINDLSRFISEYKNLKKGVLPSSVNSLGFNEMAEEEQLEKVKQEAIRLYQALENINASKQKNQNTPISNTSDSQQIRKTVEDIERENRELEKIKAIKTEINNSNFKNNNSDFDKSYYSLQARAKEIQQTMRGITSISFSKSPTGEQESSKAVIKYKNELGQIVTETMGWKNITDETGNVISKVFTTLGNLRIVDNIGTQEKQLDKLKNKILELQNSGQFQSAPIKSLFNRLEKIDLTNIQKAEQGITNLQQSVERFSNNQPKIKSLANIKQQVEQLKASLKNENTDIFSNIMNGKEGTKLTTLMKQLETQFTSLRKGSGTFNTGDIDKTVQNVKNQMTVLQREFNKNIGIDTMINKAQTALSRLGDKSALLDSGALKKFQDQFNSFSTKTSVDQIQKFIDEVNRISKNGDQINKIDSQLNKLQTNLMKLKIENGTDYLTNDKTISYFNELKGKVEELKKAQEQLRNGQYIDPTAIKNLQDRVSNAYQQMTAQAKAFRDANRGNGNNLTNTNTGKYDNLVTAFNNLNKTNLSDSFVKQLDEQIKKLGQDLSQSGVADKIKELKATITNVKGNSKQFDTLNNKLKDMTLNLSNVKSKYKDGVIPSSATNALNNYQRAMSELQSSMQKLASGQKIENITPITSNATRAMRQLNRETGNTILTQRNLGTTIQNTLSKFGIYTSMAIACRRLFQEIKEGVQYVKYLDESLEC